MPNYVVEIEWPLGGMTAGQTFNASVSVRDEEDLGGGPAVDHKVVCKLSKGAALKDTQETPLFDPVTEPTNAIALTTDATGLHKLEATLVKNGVAAPVSIDEEIDIDITVDGPTRRVLRIITFIEE